MRPKPQTMTWFSSLSISVCMRLSPMIACRGRKVKNWTSAPVKKIMPVQPSAIVAMVMKCRNGVSIGWTSP